VDERTKNCVHFFVKVPWENVALLCQNAPFDALILSHHVRIKPAFYVCTLAMARMMLPRQRHNLKLLSHWPACRRKATP
jgi:hypothetical protein